MRRVRGSELLSGILFPGSTGQHSFAMDVEGLRNRIQSTLDPNADTRRQAELELKYVRH